MNTGNAPLFASGGKADLVDANPLPVSAGPSEKSRLPANADGHAAELEIWRPVLHALGFSASAKKQVAGRARVNGSSLEAEILASGFCDEPTFYRAIARVLNIEFLEQLDPDSLAIRDRDGPALLRDPRGVRLARSVAGNGLSVVVVAPDARTFEALKSRLESRRASGDRLRIVTPLQLRAAVEQRCRYLVEQRATSALFDALPYCSSRVVLSGWQGFAGGALIAAVIAGWSSAPLATFFGIHLCASVFFFGCVALRLSAIRRGQGEERATLTAPDPSSMPRYSVLVALYDEVDMVPELLQALGKLVWPRSKLEVKLVCEADDSSTIAALKAHGLRPWVEIIEVPRGLPRTKPKALAHALQLVSGDYVALYDAEDKPHPWQLVEAWQRFEISDHALACVQAPLAISNAGHGILARMFAFEYSGLFRGILPWLSARALILPLGGTSNHFRRAALDKMGGWDPYNVTEDADLGLRVSRFGYRTETITYPTYETAPETWAIWLPQRTRWFKGWIQTWLVHMRDPRRLARELGFWSFCVSQILFAGMVISALIHPFMLATVLWLAVALLTGGVVSPLQPPLIGLDLANISLGYFAYFLLGRSTLPAHKRRHLWKVALFTPAYWLMQSVAAWRAMLQLVRDPHLWEKTPHPARPPGEALDR